MVLCEACGADHRGRGVSTHARARRLDSPRGRGISNRPTPPPRSRPGLGISTWQPRRCRDSPFGISTWQPRRRRDLAASDDPASSLTFYWLKPESARARGLPRHGGRRPARRRRGGLAARPRRRTAVVRRYTELSRAARPPLSNSRPALSSLPPSPPTPRAPPAVPARRSDAALANPSRFLRLREAGDSFGSAPRRGGRRVGSVDPLRRWPRAGTASGVGTGRQSSANEKLAGLNALYP